MDSWEDEDSAPQVPTVAPNRANLWEGEDEEEDVMDSWDQPDEPPPPPQPPAAASSVAEKKEKKAGGKKSAAASSATNIDDDEGRELTPEERAAEKLRRQKLQEESDLLLAKEIFGVSASLDSKEEYDKFREEIEKKLTDASKNSNYISFAEELIQSLCLNLSSIDIKKIHNTIGNIHIEKLKLEKGDKAKKKYKIKAKLKVDDETDYSEFSAYTGEFDFI